MGFSCGIVGLPNVGKSTLFNSLSNAKAEAANFPFCTIEPNVGIVAVPDARIGALAKVFNSEREVPTSIRFVDIAGLVRGASKGEGLGNQFLSHIREVDAGGARGALLRGRERGPRREQGRPGRGHRHDPNRAVPEGSRHREQAARPRAQAEQGWRRDREARARAVRAFGAALGSGQARAHAVDRRQRKGHFARHAAAHAKAHVLRRQRRRKFTR